MFNKTGNDVLRSALGACFLTLVLLLWQIVVFPAAAMGAAPIADAGGNQSISKGSIVSGNAILNGSVTSDSSGDAYSLEWYGPFGSAIGSPASVRIPQGTYTVSLQAVGCQESSDITTAEITIGPAFSIAARSKTNVVQLTWTYDPAMVRYDVYRASETDPFDFAKIAETTSTYSTYLDDAVTNETNYLYAVAGVDDAGVEHFSNIVAACAPATRLTARLNRPPFIYSPAVSTGTPGMIYEYTVLAADANLETLSYTLYTAPSGMTIDSDTGKIHWTPTEVGTFQVAVGVADSKGLQDNQSFTVEVTALPPSVELSAQPETIIQGSGDQNSATLSWCSTHAEYCDIEPVVGEVNPIGAVDVQPTETTEYTITAHGPGGTAVDTATVTVSTVSTPPPTVQIFANPETIVSGDTSILLWHSTNAETVTIDQGIGTVALNSDDEPGAGKIVSPSADTVYTITATGPGGTTTDSVTVKVTYLPPTVDISAFPAALVLGDSTQLYWHSANANSVVIDQEIGAVALNSNESEEDIITTPQATTTYTITATGPGGTATDSVTVTVETIPPPSVNIVAVPEQIENGDMSWLYWSSAYADTVTIDQNIGSVSANGCYGGDDEGYPGVITGECSEGKQVAPSTTTTYTITATGPGGIATDSVTVTVIDALPPTVEIIATPESIEAGDESWLYWHSTNAETVTIDQRIGTVAADGCFGGEDDGFWQGADDSCGIGKRVTPQTTTTYTITATGPGGTATDSVTITVTPVPPTVEIIAAPELIQPGDTSWLYWHSTNADHVSINQNIGVVAANGCYGYGGDVNGFPLESEEECGDGLSVSPSVTTTYTITAMGPGGIATDSVTVTVAIPPPVVDITADPERIQSGDTSWLSWSSSNATIVVIDQGIGVVAPNSCEITSPQVFSYSLLHQISQFLVQDSLAATSAGGEEECQDRIAISPSVTTTYTITAYGPGGTATDKVTVIVDGVEPPTVDIIANPEAIQSGDGSYLYWHSTNADAVSIDQQIGTVAPNGCYGYGGEYNGFPLETEEECGEGVYVTPQTTTTYTITATGPGGTVTDSVTVYVDEVPPPTVTIVADPDEISPGSLSTLIWHATNAESVNIDQGIGGDFFCYGYGGLVEDCEESVPVWPATTTTYTITATGPGGTATASATVTVITNPPPTVTITATPEVIEPGESSWLMWSATNAETVSIDQGVNANCYDDGYGGYGGLLDCNNGSLVSPTVTTTYTITASGPGGTASASVTIYVGEQPPPSVEIIANDNSIQPGDSAWLYWHSANAETVSIDNNIGVVAANGCYGGDDEGFPVTVDVACGPGILVSPTITTTYIITATGPGGVVATDSVTINVDMGGAPTAEFTADSVAVFRGESTTLRWQTQNADTVSIDQGIGGVALNSDANGLAVTPNTTTTYTLTAANSLGQGSISVTVIVIDPLPPLVDLIAWPDTVELGQYTVLAWSSDDADTVTIEPDIGPTIGDVALNSGMEGLHHYPQTTTTYTITATGPGGVATDSVTVKVLPQIIFSTCQQPLTAGESCPVTIDTVNGETVTIDQGIGVVEMTGPVDYKSTGSAILSPLEKTTYTITATGNGGTSTREFTIDIAPKVEFSVDEQIIEAGDTTHLHWSTLQADVVKIEPAPGEVAANSEPEGLAISPESSTTYTLTAEGPTNTRSLSTRVYVNDFSQPPVVAQFKAFPATINPGQTTTLSWETANMDSARIDNGIGDVPQFGSIEVSPAQSTIYTLVVQGPMGHTVKQAVVTVRGTHLPGSFSGRYQDLIPDNATITLADDRFSILTGHCFDEDGNPLAGVTVSIPSSPDFGSVSTDSEGRYAIPVKGNNHYTIHLAAQDFLSAQRKAQVLNNRIAVIEPVILVKPDERVTEIDFSNNTDEVLFHGGLQHSDERGQRRLCLTIPDSGFSQPINIVTTEYESQQSLPAELPPTASFAYVAEIGTADSSAITFTTPVTGWVENFLNFPAGQIVPVGWYDKSQGKWIPQDNGLVVQLLDQDGDGTVDGVDIDGDLQADDLDNDGEFEDEVAGLPSGEVQAGASYFRFNAHHTGSWALSWPHASLDAAAPSPDGPSYDLESCPAGDCQLVQEDISIPGTEFSLHYSEARVSSYQPNITIPVTGQDIPASVERVLVRMTIAGQEFEQELAPEPDQTVQFQWDGRDYKGQEVTGAAVADIAIGYVYERNYALAGGGYSHAFSQSGSGDSAIAGREKFISWHLDRLELHRLTASEDFIADGWTLSPQHQTSTSGTAALYMGDGSLLSKYDDMTKTAVYLSRGYYYGVINHSTGQLVYGSFANLSGIDVDDNTEMVYWIDKDFDAVFSFYANSTTTFNLWSSVPSTVLGDYFNQSLLNNPQGIVFDDVGNLYYSDKGTNYVNGRHYQHFAGNGQAGYSGDGGSALAASLNGPGPLAHDHWGNLFIIDEDNYVVRRISADGIIETIAGNGTRGSSGDNGLAIDAAIDATDIAIDNQGNIFLTEPSYHKIRKIDVSGTITTFAGNGVLGTMTSGIGDPASLAELVSPTHITINSLGHLFIGDNGKQWDLLEVDGNNILRKIDNLSFGTIGVMTTDMQDRIFFSEAVSLDVYKLHKPTFAQTSTENNNTFTDSNGYRHTFSSLGKHLYTETKYTFIYNLDNLLIAIQDMYGNAIVTINRDADGKVISIESGAGTCTLDIDENSHLVEFVTPDDAYARMTYNDQGVLTDFSATYTGTIQGTITDSSSGTPLNGASVILTNGQTTTSVQSDENGVYSFPNVSPGPFSLTFNHAGYFNSVETGSIIFGASNITLDVSMLAYPAIDLTIVSPSDGATLDGQEITVTGHVASGSTVTVNGTEATVTNNNYSCIISLTGEGEHEITVNAVDSYGQTASQVVRVVVVYPALELEITTPSDDTVFYSSPIQVNGRVSSGATVYVNGTPAAVSGEQFTAEISLSTEGTHTITATATDRFGQQQEDTVAVNYFQLPFVSLSASSNLLLPGKTITLSWTSENCDRCILEPSMVEVNCTGEMEVAPDQNTTYTINGYGFGKIARDSVTILLGNTYGNPSIPEQVHMEAINKARANPTVEADRLQIDLNEGPPREIISPDPVQPLVFNHYLHMSSTLHSEDMAANDYMEHQGLDGRQPQDRMLDAGYLGGTTGENLSNRVFFTPVDDEASLSLQLHDDLFIDYDVDGRGHRINILLGNYKEIGIGFIPDSVNANFPYGGVVTCNFGSFPEGPNFLLGVIYDDTNNDGQYSAGEGINQVEISIGGTDEQTYTADAGGYGLPLPSGSYTITAKLPDGRVSAKQFSLDGQNVKVDFTLADFDANPEPKIELEAESTSIHLGQSTTLLWTINHASKASLDQGIGIVPLTGAVVVSPTETTTYTVTAQSGVATVEKSIEIIVLPPLPAPTLAVSPGTIWIGENATLSWTTENTTSCSIDNGIGDVSLAGSMTISPEETTTYTITAVNDQGSTTAQATVTVEKPSASLVVDVMNIDLGGSATLEWSSEFSDTCILSPDNDAVALSDSITVSPTVTTEYTLTCSKDGVTAESSITIYVNNYAEVPFAELSADHSVIRQGESAQLSWVSSNANEFFVDNGIGSVAPYGQLSVSPANTTTYTFSAIGPAGVANASVTIYVTGSPEAQPKGSFGEQYMDVVSADATVTAFEAHRFALVRGTVQNVLGQPLSGVVVSLLDNPQYGTALTSVEGEFALAVDGGAPMTLVYSKEGFLPGQRQVYVPWNDTAIAKTIQLVQQDSKATAVHFDGSPNTVVTHRSSITTDSFGSRSVTMVFHGDNHAYLVDKEGVSLGEMPTINVRATEYSTPQSMPAELPETSAFTYCAELQVDGAERVHFAKPVVTFVDNFLGFSVGEAIPFGYYNQDKGVWIAEPNGVVVRLLDTDSDGVVDAIDSDGDGQADDLDNDGDIHDEADGLGDTSAYAPGATFWRAEVTHFSPYDWNWCRFLKLLYQLFGYGDAALDEELCPECKSQSGSSVSNESFIFREEIPIPGTSLYLVYASDRAKGYKTRITVPASSDDVPDYVKRIEVRVEVAGVELSQTLQAEPNQVAEFFWDGLDFLGRQVEHKVTARIKIGYVYDSTYMPAGFTDQAFGEYGDAGFTNVPARDEVISWRQSELAVNLTDKTGDLGQGWSLSAHHKLDPTDPSTLHKGDGSMARNIVDVLSTQAGTGEEGWAISGEKALDTPISNPVSTVIDARGDLYVATQITPAVLKISREGVVEVIAGGMSGSSYDEGIEATQARLSIPSDIALDSSGNLYIADTGTCKIRKVDGNGIISTIAGTGDCDYSGDDGPALSAGIRPTSVAADDFGNIYFVESNSCSGGTVDPVTGVCSDGTVTESSYRLRKVSTNGRIHTIAGTGDQYDPNVDGQIVNGGPAKGAPLSNPTSVSVDPEGNIYLADGSRIRKINTSGIITTVAGTGLSAYAGDGGLAVNAQITLASGVTFDRSGNFYFSQFYGNGDVVRKVSANGYISTVAGEGTYGQSGDNGPATHGRLYQPNRVAIDPAGFISIPDTGNNLIRKVALEGYTGEEIHFTEQGVGYLFSADGLHQTTYDLESGIPLLDFFYDDGDRLTSIVDAYGNTTEILRQADGSPWAIVSPDGLRTELTFDNNNQLTGITLPDHNAYTFEYDGNDGLPAAKIEPNGNRFEHYFDDAGRVTHTNNQEGGLWQFEKSEAADGTVTSVTRTPNTVLSFERLNQKGVNETTTAISPNGETTTSITSADGLDITSESSCGMRTETYLDLDKRYGYTYPHEAHVYSPDGLHMETTLFRDYLDEDLDGLPEEVTEQITVNNHTTTVVHDVAHAQVQTTSPEGRTTTSSYDPNTMATLAIEVPGLHATSFSYFTDGRLQGVTTGDRSASYTYDDSGNLTTVTAPDGKVTRFTDYDAIGRLLRAENPDGSVVRYQYDENGNMTVLTTPTPADNIFNYNHVSKPSSFVSPLGSTTSYRYNSEHRLLGVTLPSGKTIDNSIVNGQLTSTTTAEWTTSYEYDCGDKVSAITRGSETIDFTYDGSLPISETRSGTIGETFIYSYNNDFQLSSVSYGGSTTDLSYDDDGLLIGAGTFSINRNADNGLPESVEDGNYTLGRSFNGYGEVTDVDATVGGGNVFGYSLSRDLNGRITHKTENIQGQAVDFAYTYDDFGRLLTVTRDGLPTESYSYDNNGNRIRETNTDLAIDNRELSWSDEDHIVQAGDITYSYDLDDYLATRTNGTETTEYFYSSTGELQGVTLPDSTAITYIQDPLGRRIAKLENGTVTEKYLWSGLTTLLAVYDSSDNIKQRFFYGDDRMPVAMLEAGSTYYLHYDQVGSLRLVTDSAGNSVKQVVYDSFGNIISDSNESFTVPFGFAGGLHDRDTGLVRFGYRDYMAELGKWTAKDPILFDGGDSNLYGYVQNDPVNFVDPEGLVKLPGVKSFLAKKLASSLRKRAVSDAWKMERRLVKETGNGTRAWTKSQKKELLSNGKVSGFEGHHINSVEGSPQLAGNPNNIMFVEGRSEHLLEHGGNFQTTTSGPLLDRTANGTLSPMVLRNGRTLYDLGPLLLGLGITGLELLDYADPIGAFLAIMSPRECH